MGDSKDKTDGVEADPVLEPLLKILAEGQVLGSKQELATHMASDKVTKFKPLGKLKIYAKNLWLINGRFENLFDLSNLFTKILVVGILFLQSRFICNNLYLNFRKQNWGILVEFFEIVFIFLIFFFHLKLFMDSNITIQSRHILITLIFEPLDF